MCIYIYIHTYVHTRTMLTRSDPTDCVKEISIDENGDRAEFRRRGRPKLKWCDTAKALVIQTQVEGQSIPATWKTHLSNREIDSYMIEAAEERLHRFGPEGLTTCLRAQQYIHNIYIYIYI